MKNLIFPNLMIFYHLIIKQTKLIKNLQISILIKDYLKEIEKLKYDISLTTNNEHSFVDINHLLIGLSEITGDN